MKKHLIFLASVCMLSIVLCGAVSSAYPSNVQITQSADNLTGYNYSSGNSIFPKKQQTWNRTSTRLQRSI